MKHNKKKQVQIIYSLKYQMLNWTRCRCTWQLVRCTVWRQTWVTWRSVPGASAAPRLIWSCPSWRSRSHQQLLKFNSLSYRWDRAAYAPIFIAFFCSILDMNTQLCLGAVWRVHVHVSALDFWHLSPNCCFEERRPRCGHTVPLH